MTAVGTVEPAAAARATQRAQSLADGAIGDALLAVEYARVGRRSWQDAHAALSAATRHPLTSTAQASLFFGAPAVAFVLHLAAAGSGRYRDAFCALDDRVRAITAERLRLARGRIDRGERPRASEFDLFYGLTGLGAYHLCCDPDSPILGDILAYLVRLTLPLPDDPDHLPGWWTAREPAVRTSPEFPGGHGNLGMAHGISGPLTLLALASLSGRTVQGHADAIARICAWLDSCRQDTGTGPWWPPWVTLDEHRTGTITQALPGRPSWCYGTPGLARAQQLAGQALGDPARQHVAERALTACLANPQQLTLITDAGLCHGAAGLFHATRRVASDAPPGTFAPYLPALRSLFEQPAATPRRQRAARRNHRARVGRAHRPGHGHIGAAMGRLPPAQPRRGVPMTSQPGQAAAADWHQVLIQFTNWRDAEQIAATCLRPRLIQAQHAGLIGQWWFLRKYPCWRFRLHPGPCLPAAGVAIGEIMNELTAAGQVSTWRPGIYEPETFAFGGPRGTEAAHRLFHHDSLGFLDYARRDVLPAANRPVAGRRELSVLLCTTLLRSAGQDCYEQGDVWHRIAQMRPLQQGSHPSSPQAIQLATALRRLMTVSPAAVGPPLAFAAPWLSGFSEAGRAIAAAGNAGELERGTRSILAHLVIFHWNRLGFTTQTQAILSRTLRDTIMDANNT